MRLRLLFAPESEVELDRPAEDVVDPLARVERGVRHLEDELHLLELAPVAVAEVRLEPIAVEGHLSLARRQQARHDPREGGLAAAGLADDPHRMAAQDRHVDVPEHGDGRFAPGAPAVAGGDVLHLQGGRLAFVLGGGLVALPRRRRRPDGRHQPSRVVMRRMIDDLIGGPLLLDVACVQDDDVVRDLGDDGEVVGHVDRRRALLLDDRLERLQHLDLGGDVKGGGRLVEDQEVRIAAQGHRRHQPLELPPGDLVRVAPAEAVGIGEVEGPVELFGPAVGLIPGELAVEHRRLGHLLPDRERGIEGRGRALGEVGDTLAAELALLVGRHGDDVAAVEAHLPAGELEPRLGVPEGGEGDGGLAGARLADEGDHLAALHLEAHPLDDGGEGAVVLAGVDRQAVDLEESGHQDILIQIILFASRPPAWAETSSTIMLMEIVRVAIARAGTRGAMEP